MSSVALTNKFAKTFPKRGVWYSDFVKPRKVRTYIVVTGVLSPVLFLFAMMVSLQVAVNLAAYQPATPPAAVALAVPEPQADALTASINEATVFFHVPGAYTDTSVAVPQIERPQFPVSDTDVAEAAAIAPYFAQSLSQTVAGDWDKTFGLGGRVFVASVYEFGQQGAAVAGSELNVKESWHDYIDGLSTALEPYVTK